MIYSRHPCYNALVRFLLALLLLAAFLNALAWIILIPVWQYPDEQAHFAQVQYIAEIGGTPKDNRSFDTSLEVSISEKILGTERDEAGNNKFTYHPEYKLSYQDSLYGLQEVEIASLPKSARSEMVKNEATLNPPLYYFLSAQVYKIFSAGNLFTRVYAVRLLSGIFLLLTIFLAFKIGRLIFQDKQSFSTNNRILPPVLAALIAFKPMLVFSSTGVLPDSLIIFLFTSFIYFSLMIIKVGFRLKESVLILAIIILGAATRQHFLITLFILPIIIVYRIIIDKKQKFKILSLLVSFAVLLFIASYFVPALDFIHRLDYPESSRKIPGNPLANLTYLEHLNWTIRHSVTEVLPWFWGVYKWLSLTLPPVVYQIINRLLPFAAIGVIFKIIEIVKTKNLKKEFWFFFLILVSVIYFMAITTFDYFYRRNNGFSFGIQGRYFFPPIVVQMALLLIGFWQLFKIVFKKYARYALVVLAILIIIFNDISLAFVAASYYDTSNLSILITQVSQYKPQILKGNILYFFLTMPIIFQAIFLFSLGKYTLRESK